MAASPTLGAVRALPGRLVPVVVAIVTRLGVQEPERWQSTGVLS